jgi:hypothetical protein
MGEDHDPPATAKPRVFVGSSSESEKYADATKRILEKGGKLSVEHWRDFFERAGSKTAIEVLTSAVEKFDFSVFILSPDDIRTLRNETGKVVRDNVIFEVGLFIGALGRDRVFLITSDNYDANLPDDLGGVNIGAYRADEGNPDSAIRGTASKFRDIMEDMPRRLRSTMDAYEGVGGRFAARDQPAENEVWLQAYEAGVLEELQPGQVRVGRRVVHTTWGPGTVTEVGPSRGGSRYLTVEFLNGTATVLSVNLRLQQFHKPED